MLSHQLFDSARVLHRQIRPLVLAVFSYRNDAELVPGLLANIAPAVDGWVAFDDRDATDVFSSEPRRRRLLIERAIALGATWILALDPDERMERGSATRIRTLTRERQRIIWEFNLREMFTPTSYRTDGIWGAKMQGRLFPAFDGPQCSEKPMHGQWCIALPGCAVLPSGLNLYHLKMMSPERRQSRRELYRHLDPANRFQPAGYDYLTDETGAVFETIPPGRDFFPLHHEAAGPGTYMATTALSRQPVLKNGPAPHALAKYAGPPTGTALQSQLGQLRILHGNAVRTDAKLTVVVIGFRAPASLASAVSSLLRQDTPAEIIVVNSGGGDVAQILGKLLPHVTLAMIHEPVYVGAARNIGILLSQAPYVAFLAADCTAEPGWVAGRLKGHLDGHRAVGCAVENDKPRNPFAWAAHLMTYGHRMASSDPERVVYGASYHREIFDKYGYFSETMIIGEDSEFHARFKRGDTIVLSPAVRTIHRNPTGLPSFLRDQFNRGLRGRYMADFLSIDYTLSHIAAASYARVARAFKLSITVRPPQHRLWAFMAWPVLPIGGLFYQTGMIVSFVRISMAERCARKATSMALVERPEEAIGLLRRALVLRPVTARYHRSLGALLNGIRNYDQGAREIYACRDIGRERITDLQRDSFTRMKPATPLPKAVIDLRVIVFCDGSDTDLAEFLRALGGRKPPSVRLEVLVVEASGTTRVSKDRDRILKPCARFAKIVSLTDAQSTIVNAALSGATSKASFVAVSSTSCLPGPDWLSLLAAHIEAHPGVDLFHGLCRPLAGQDAPFVASLTQRLQLYPGTGHSNGVFRFSHAANWACRTSTLAAAGGLHHVMAVPLSTSTLTERVMRAGGSSIEAPDWEMQLRLDPTVMRLMRRAYHDGRSAERHGSVTNDRDFASRVFLARRLRQSPAAVWRFAMDGLKNWRQERPPLTQYPAAILLLVLTGVSRQAGWLFAAPRKKGPA